MTLHHFLQAAAAGGQWDKGEADFHAYLPLYFQAKDAGLIVGNEYRSAEGPDDEVLSFLVDRLTETGKAELARR